MNHRQLAEKHFGKELSLIKLNIIKEFVLYCFDCYTADYFWTIPTSTTGKYHPQISLGAGGLVRHVKLAVWWGIEFFKCYNLPESMLDYVIAALLLHDIRKNGDQLNKHSGERIDDDALYTHGGKTANLMFCTEQRKYDMVMPAIGAAIAGHMGKWTAGGFENYVFYNVSDPNHKIISQIVHFADYAASRKIDSIMDELRE